MLPPPLTEKQYEQIAWAACKQIDSSERTRRQLRRSFDTTNAALVNVETDGLETFGGPRLPPVIALFRGGDVFANAERLEFSIHGYLNDLRAQLLRRPDQQVFQASLLGTFLLVTKEAWKLCSEQGYVSRSFVPRERYLLAVVIKTALSQSDPRATS